MNGYFEAGTILGSYPNTLRQSSVWFRDKVLITFLPFQSVQFSLSVFATPWTAGCQASLSITNPQSLLKLMSIESLMPSNHLILYHPLRLLPSIFLSIRVFSNESVLCIRWPKYWNFSFSPSNEYSGLISFRMYKVAIRDVELEFKFKSDS